MNKAFDVAVVGGGIIGIATARELLKRLPHFKMVVLEKEKKIGQHQSGRNSGVIHAGIYYEPGSLRAKLCIEGMKLLYEYCDLNNIPYKKCGKIIVAVNQNELGRLQTLYDRSKQNSVADVQFINSNEIRDIEPYCQGLKALYSPNTGIVDFTQVTKSLANGFIGSGGTILTDFKVTKFDKTTDTSDCNEYPVSVIKESNNGVPDPRFPFLGVHFTPRIDGSVWLGPNAVLAFSREGYSWTDLNFKDFFDAVSYGGLRKLAFRYIGEGSKQMYKSLIIHSQVKDLQKFVPSLNYKHVTRGPSGVRAQALSREGQLVEDFVLEPGCGEFKNHILNVRNTPSPAATSSLALAKLIADGVQKNFVIAR